MSKYRGFLQLIRPMNCIMMGLAVIVGAVIANTTDLINLSIGLLFGFLTSFFLTASSMVLNDYYDLKIDIINEPNRPIPSGLVEPKEALLFALLLTILGLALSANNAHLNKSPFPIIIAIVAWLVFFTYAVKGKRTGLFGNFMVSMCVSVPFIYGNIIALNSLEPKVMIFVSMVFLANTGREITKGIVDKAGDSSQNVKTLAVLFDSRKAASIASLFYISAVFLSPIPLILNVVSLWFIPFVIITDIGLLVSSLILVLEPSREKAKMIKQVVLLCFLFGLLAFLIGTIRV